MSIDDLPVRRSIAIAQPIDWLVAGHAQYTVHRTVISGSVIDRNRNHLVIRWPQGGRINCGSTNHWRLSVVYSHGKCTRRRRAIQPGVGYRDSASTHWEDRTGRLDR